MKHQPTRRSMIKSAAALATLAAAGAPAILTRMSKAADKQKVFGTGYHTYEFVDGWAKHPENMPWGNTHMVQEVEDGRIFVCHSGPNSVHMYDPDGKFMGAWGDDQKGGAHGMDLRKEGNEEFLYFCPTGQHRFFKTNLKGEKVFEFGYPKDAKNSKGEPCYVDEKKFVPDLHRVRPQRRFLYHRWLRLQLRSPIQLQRRIYLHLRRHRQRRRRTEMPPWHLVRHARSLQPDDSCGRPHERSSPVVHPRRQVHQAGQPRIARARAISISRAPISSSPTCTAASQSSTRTTISSPSFVTIPTPPSAATTACPKDQLAPGQFCTPHGAIWDRAGNIFVAEWLPYGRVTKLRHVNA